MLKLRYADYKGVFHGFVLKEGYFYGRDDETDELIAASGYETDGNVRIYRLQEGQWNACWVKTSNTAFEFIGLETRFDANRLSFREWLATKGYDENACKNLELDDLAAMSNEYELYHLFEGLPEFAIDWLKEHSPKCNQTQGE